MRIGQMNKIYAPGEGINHHIGTWWLFVPENVSNFVLYLDLFLGIKEVGTTPISHNICYNIIVTHLAYKSFWVGNDFLPKIEKYIRFIENEIE
jgi:hypothetical protein